MTNGELLDEYTISVALLMKRWDALASKRGKVDAYAEAKKKYDQVLTRKRELEAELLKRMKEQES